jgi:hypothetical protein
VDSSDRSILSMLSALDWSVGLERFLVEEQPVSAFVIQRVHDAIPVDSVDKLRTHPLFDLWLCNGVDLRLIDGVDLRLIDGVDELTHSLVCLL